MFDLVAGHLEASDVLRQLAAAVQAVSEQVHAPSWLQLREVIDRTLLVKYWMVSFRGKPCY